MASFGHALDAIAPRAHSLPARHPRAKHRETWEFRLIFAVAYPIYLAAAAVERLNPWSAPRASGRSVFEDARQAAYTSIPYAFMG